MPRWIIADYRTGEKTSIKAADREEAIEKYLDWTRENLDVQKAVNP